MAEPFTNPWPVVAAFSSAAAAATSAIAAWLSFQQNRATREDAVFAALATARLGLFQARQVVRDVIDLAGSNWQDTEPLHGLGGLQTCRRENGG